MGVVQQAMDHPACQLAVQHAVAVPQQPGARGQHDRRHTWRVNANLSLSRPEGQSDVPRSSEVSDSPFRGVSVIAMQGIDRLAC